MSPTTKWAAVGKVSGARSPSFGMTPMRWVVLIAAILVGASVLVALLGGLLSS